MSLGFIVVALAGVAAMASWCVFAGTASSVDSVNDAGNAKGDKSGVRLGPNPVGSVKPADLAAGRQRVNDTFTVQVVDAVSRQSIISEAVAVSRSGANGQWVLGQAYPSDNLGRVNLPSDKGRTLLFRAPGYADQRLQLEGARVVELQRMVALDVSLVGVESLPRCLQEWSQFVVCIQPDARGDGSALPDGARRHAVQEFQCTGPSVGCSVPEGDVFQVYLKHAAESAVRCESVLITAPGVVSLRVARDPRTVIVRVLGEAVDTGIVTFSGKLRHARADLLDGQACLYVGALLDGVHDAGAWGKGWTSGGTKIRVVGGVPETNEIELHAKPCNAVTLRVSKPAQENYALHAIDVMRFSEGEWVTIRNSLSGSSDPAKFTTGNKITVNNMEAGGVLVLRKAAFGGYTSVFLSPDVFEHNVQMPSHELLNLDDGIELCREWRLQHAKQFGRVFLQLSIDVSGMPRTWLTLKQSTVDTCIVHRGFWKLMGNKNSELRIRIDGGNERQHMRIRPR